MGLRSRRFPRRCLLTSTNRPADRRAGPQEGERMAAPRTAPTTPNGRVRACAAVTAALATAGSATMLFTGAPALAAGSASGPSRSVVVTGAAPAELIAR